jgi:hypothetical protein
VLIIASFFVRAKGANIVGKELYSTTQGTCQISLCVKRDFAKRILYGGYDSRAILFKGESLDTGIAGSF